MSSKSFLPFFTNCLSLPLTFRYPIYANQSRERGRGREREEGERVMVVVEGTPSHCVSAATVIWVLKDLLLNYDYNNNKNSI